MKKIRETLIIPLALSTLTIYSVSAQRPNASRFQTLSATAPARTATFDCSNPATYHADSDGSFQCGYSNQGAVPNGGPPKASNGSGYSGSANNYDCYYYATNPSAAAFYNSSTDTRTYPANCQTYSAPVGTPINSALVLLIAAGVVVGGVMVYRTEINKKRTHLS